MVIQTEHTMLVPDGGGLCWKLYEKKSGKDVSEKTKSCIKIDDETYWSFTGKYPSSIEYALTCAMETALRNHYGDEAKDVKGAITAFNLAKDELIAAIGEQS